jgi:hypothetical protein
VTVGLNLADVATPLDPVFYGIALSGVVMVVLTLLIPARRLGAG